MMSVGAENRRGPDEPAPDGVEAVLAGWVQMLERGGDPGAPSGFPVIAETPETGGATETLARLRRFHAGHPVAGDAFDPPDDGFLPALLRPFRDAALRHDYPLLLGAIDPGADDSLSAPLADFLAGLVEQVDPDPDATRILRDNLPRLEHCVRESMNGADHGVAASDALAEAARMTEEGLQLRGDSAERLHGDLQKLVELVPSDGTLLELGPRTPLLLFLHVAEQHARHRRVLLETDVIDLRNRLRDLLRLDDAKHAGTDRPDALAGSLGTGGDTHIDPEALARVVGTTRGAVPMGTDRHDRINGALDIFQRYLDGVRGPLVHVVQPDAMTTDASRPGVAWREADPTSICREAVRLFDETATRFAELFGAMRLARLEVQDAYDPARHDGLRASFDWRSFTPHEIQALPLVLAVESADHLAGAGMLDLSRLLLSGRPVNVLVTVQPATNPGFTADDEPLGGFRFELGYLGISHREALVSQSSAARPEHLLAGFRRGVDATRASLHVVASGLSADGEQPPLGAWLHDGAALEGRAHPVFRYDPEAGETWARRLDFSGNPRPETDWPVYILPCARPDGERQNVAIAFTFADFALMEPCYRHHFQVVPPDVSDDGLIALDAFLASSPEAAGGRVPYIQAIDDANCMHRVAVTERLAFACRDRLDYWRTLQELAGVRNEYVREALERQAEKLEAEFAARREAIAADHEAEIGRVRDEAAGQAMRRLAEALLATDVASLAAPAAPAAAPAPAPAPASAPAPPAPEPEPEPAPRPSDEPEEPWIESILCTTCNDCLDINPRLFVYNANKQAIIGDPEAGTYDELVRAAEKCPARCIHPGTPLNPAEENLENLIERAKPFNT